jgi:hypothetical protein
MPKQKKKHAGGRPTTYTPALVAKAREYLEAYKKAGDMIPSVVGLCAYIGRAKSTLYAWRDDQTKPEFSDILKAIDEAQENALLNGGLSKDFNPIITKLVLSKHGYHDKADIDHTTNGEKIEPTRIIFEDGKPDA